MKKPLRRSNGIYYGVITVGGHTTWRSLRTSDYSIAMERLHTVRKEIIPRRMLRVADFFKEFLRIREVQNSPKTLEMYKWCFDDFLRISGDKALKQIGPLDFENYKIGKMREGVERITVNIQLKHLRAAFRACVKLKILSESPCEGVSFLPVDRKEAVYLTELELRRLLMAIQDLDFRNLVLVTVLTAMRRGEVINLPWKHVDFDRKEIQIRSFGSFRPKARQDRVIPMNWWVLKYLQEKPRLGEYVFTKSNGSPFTGDGLNQRLKRSINRAGLDKRLHFHSLRHTGISWLINIGVPPSHVQRIAGHSSIRVTQGYIHVGDRHLHEAVNMLTPPVLN